MFYQRARQLFKYTLFLARIKLLYTRITLTRFTTFYFLLSLSVCIGLVSLQGLTLSDNTQAVRLLGTVFAKSQKMTGLPLITNGVLKICPDIPDRSITCTAMASFGGLMPIISGGVQKRTLVNTGPLTDGCVASLKWLDDMLHDAQREDVVSLVFRLWLFILSVVAILNESIPHLAAAFMGQVLGAAWASYRMRSTVMIRDRYHKYVVGGACGGVDFMGDWWEMRISHGIPIVVLNVIALLGTGYFTYKLFQVYSSQSLSRVGASEKIYRIYKIVLLFSVCVQLSVFFSIASATMWIDKASHGPLHALGKHGSLYLAIFITDLIVHVPWFYIGWTCVRKESRLYLCIFGALSVYMVASSSVVLNSPRYRYIFSTWPFFATVTVTSYCLVIASTVLVVICRCNFGKGLAHYLLVTEAPDGVDFAPVNFVTTAKGNDNNLEKGDSQLNDSKTFDLPTFPDKAWQPLKQKGASVMVNSKMDARLVTVSLDPPLIAVGLDRAYFYKPCNTYFAHGQKVKGTTLTLPPGLGSHVGTEHRDVPASNLDVDLTTTTPSVRDDTAPAGAHESSASVSTRASSPRIGSGSPTSRLLTGRGLPASPRSRIL